MSLKIVNNSDPGDADHVGGNDWDQLATQVNTWNTTFALGEQYMYLVMKSGSTYYVKSSSGTIVHSGATSATEIQWALDNLTVGRTYKQTVVLKGPFTISTRLDISSYTRVVLDGSITLANGVGSAFSIFRNKNYGTSVDSNIEICGGGYIDGNVAGGASCHGIAIGGTTDFSIHDISVKNMGAPSGRGLYIITNSSSLVTRRGSIYNVVCDGCTDSGIEFAGTLDGDATSGVYDLNVSNVWSINSVTARGFCFSNCNDSHLVNCHAINNQGSSGRGFDLSYGSNNNTLTNCWAENNNLDGFAIAASPGADPSNKNHFINCIAKGNTINGIATSADDTTVIGGECLLNGESGYRSNADRNICIGLNSKNNSQTTPNTSAGFDIHGGDNNIVIGCVAHDDQGTRTQRWGLSISSGCDNNMIEGCQFYNNLQAAQISNAGSGNRIETLQTFNKGEATFSGDGTTKAFAVTHGLTSTPTIAFIQPTTSDAMGANYISAYASTTFTVTFGVAPPTGTSNVKFNWRANVF